MAKLSITLAIATLVLVGCKHTNKVEPTTRAAETEQKLARIEPDTKVGTVTAVLPGSSLLAVGRLSPEETAIGDVLVLMTPEGKIIGAGHVVEKVASGLHVKYDVNERARKPQVGDLAVKPKM